MYKSNMYFKKVPKKKTSIDFTIEAYDELQNFKKRMQTDASNSKIVNELIMIFLDLPDEIKQSLDAECNLQIRRHKKQYATVTELDEIEQIDHEIERYQRLKAFLQLIS